MICLLAYLLVYLMASERHGRCTKSQSDALLPITGPFRGWQFVLSACILDQQ